MKGVQLDKLRTLASAILDKADALLAGEPARAIGYGAAVIIWLAVQIANARGITAIGTNLSFDQAVGVAFAAIVTVTTVVEAIRQFVYSPATLVSILHDQIGQAWMDGHEAAHNEIAIVQASQEKATVVKVPVGTESGRTN